MVEILFSNKKEKKDVVKVGIVFNKIDKKNLSDFFTSDELDLLLSVAKREDFKATDMQTLTAKTKDNNLALISTKKSPSPYDFQLLGGKLYALYKNHKKVVVYTQTSANVKLKTADVA